MLQSGSQAEQPPRSTSSSSSQQEPREPRERRGYIQQVNRQVQGAAASVGGFGKTGTMGKMGTTGASKRAATTSELREFSRRLQSTVGPFPSAAQGSGAGSGGSAGGSVGSRSVGGSSGSKGQQPGGLIAASAERIVPVPMPVTVSGSGLDSDAGRSVSATTSDASLPASAAALQALKALKALKAVKAGQPSQPSQDTRATQPSPVGTDPIKHNHKPNHKSKTNPKPKPNNKKSKDWIKPTNKAASAKWVDVSAPEPWDWQGESVENQHTTAELWTDSASQALRWDDAEEAVNHFNLDLSGSCEQPAHVDGGAPENAPWSAPSNVADAGEDALQPPSDISDSESDSHSDGKGSAAKFDVWDSPQPNDSSSQLEVDLPKKPQEMLFGWAAFRPRRERLQHEADAVDASVTKAIASVAINTPQQTPQTQEKQTQQEKQEPETPKVSPKQQIGTVVPAAQPIRVCPLPPKPSKTIFDLDPLVSKGTFVMPMLSNGVAPTADGVDSSLPSDAQSKDPEVESQPHDAVRSTPDAAESSHAVEQADHDEAASVAAAPAPREFEFATYVSATSDSSEYGRHGKKKKIVRPVKKRGKRRTTWDDPPASRAAAKPADPAADTTAAEQPAADAPPATDTDPAATTGVTVVNFETWSVEAAPIAAPSLADPASPSADPIQPAPAVAATPTPTTTHSTPANAPTATARSVPGATASPLPANWRYTRQSPGLSKPAKTPDVRCNVEAPEFVPASTATLAGPPAASSAPAPASTYTAKPGASKGKRSAPVTPLPRPHAAAAPVAYPTVVPGMANSFVDPASGMPYAAMAIPSMAMTPGGQMMLVALAPGYAMPHGQYMPPQMYYPHSGAYPMAASGQPAHSQPAMAMPVPVPMSMPMSMPMPVPVPMPMQFPAQMQHAHAPASAAAVSASAAAAGVQVSTPVAYGQPMHSLTAAPGAKPRAEYAPQHATAAYATGYQGMQYMVMAPMQTPMQAPIPPPRSHVTIRPPHNAATHSTAKAPFNRQAPAFHPRSQPPAASAADAPRRGPGRASTPSAGWAVQGTPTSAGKQPAYRHESGQNKGRQPANATCTQQQPDEQQQDELDAAPSCGQAAGSAGGPLD
ncbi:hypothetical protein BC831DRAFT_455068 [Entophlyctis helioformis]|nr:hypothetical protein BC831DRAFT_455068 [Entophlyctis helioformis]